MSEVKRKFLPLAKIKANQQNPRVISESKLKKLINSLLVFPKMMSLRPITVDDDCYVLGGNMRLTALGRIAQMTFEELQAHVESLPEYADMQAGQQQALIEYWETFLSKPQAEVQYASKMTDSEKQQFIIKDNVSFGDWDYDELENWDSARLEDWGVDTQLPDFGSPENGGGDYDEGERKISETERLSEVKFVDCYYTPVDTPDVSLKDCINLELYNKKVEVIEQSNLSCEIKETMKMLAYRFIKIDFESVANYYAFKATEEEKRVIERLRCVLVDGAIDGFLEDRMLRVNDHFNQ